MRLGSLQVVLQSLGLGFPSGLRRLDLGREPGLRRLDMDSLDGLPNADRRRHARDRLGGPRITMEPQPAPKKRKPCPPCVFFGVLTWVVLIYAAVRLVGKFF